MNYQGLVHVHGEFLSGGYEMVNAILDLKVKNWRIWGQFKPYWFFLNGVLKLQRTGNMEKKCIFYKKDGDCSFNACNYIGPNLYLPLYLVHVHV